MLHVLWSCALLLLCGYVAGFMIGIIGDCTVVVARENDSTLSSYFDLLYFWYCTSAADWVRTLRPALTSQPPLASD